MERLTKRGNTSHENGVCCTHFMGKECNEVAGNCAHGCRWEEEVWSKMAEYEDLEEQGLLLRLPCKIGDTMWTIRCGRGCSKTAQQGIVSEMFFTEEMRLMIVVKYVARGEFGKTVFHTQEEAEEAIERNSY